MIRRILSGVLMGFLCFACTGSLPASTFSVFSEPTPTYTSSTTLIHISGIPELTNVSSISGGGLTVSFSSLMQRDQVPSSWATWNCPPATESCTPAVLWSLGASDVTMSLSSPESTFGFEAEPDSLVAEPMTANFFNGGTLLGSISLDPDGNGGALLFAASSSTPFTSVEFIDGAGDDFAIANVRFSPTEISPIPEPAPVLLVSTGFGALMVGYLVRRVQRQREIAVPGAPA